MRRVRVLVFALLLRWIASKFQPCTPSNGLTQPRRMHVVICDNLDKRPHYRAIEAIDTWNISSFLLLDDGVVRVNVCEGKAWDEGYLTKSIAYHNYLRNLIAVTPHRLSDNTYAMLMDSDTIWAINNIAQLWEKYDCARGDKDIVVSSDMGCWAGSHCSRNDTDRWYYNLSSTPTPSVFVNSGVVIGKASLLLNMLRVILENNVSYFTLDKRKVESKFNDHYAITDYSLRIAPNLVAIDYYQQIVGSFAVYLPESKPALNGKAISKIVCKSKNGSIDYHCKDISQNLRLKEPKYFKLNESTCQIYRLPRNGHPGFSETQDLAPRPAIWHGSGSGRRTYVSLARDVMGCYKSTLNGSVTFPTSKAKYSEISNITLYAKCPCVSNPRSNREYHPQPENNKICLLRSPTLALLLKTHPEYFPLSNNATGYQFLWTMWSTKGISRRALGVCRAVIDFIPEQPLRSSCSHKYLCPEACAPKPLTSIPTNWLLDQNIWDSNNNQYDDIAIVCSMTIGMIKGRIGPMKYSPRYVRAVIEHIVERRVQECVEREYWLRPSNSTYGSLSSLYLPPLVGQPRRKVFGLIIWVASVTRLDMAISQMEVLSNQWKNSPNDYIAGWLASEEQYSCRIGSGTCRPMNSNFSNLHKESEVNKESFGWQCAQRRPLRALAHIFHLYDMDFVHLMDDDTFLNVKFFNPNHPLTNFIRQEMAEKPYVIGYLEDLYGGGKITRQGIFYGGRGYLMGKAVIDRLQSYKIIGPVVTSDVYRSADQMNYFSILNTVYDSLNECPKQPYHDKACLTITSNNGQWSPYNTTAQSSVRLIDLCVSMLSKEYTCDHSDHAMTRCLAHGVYSIPINVDCRKERDRQINKTRHDGYEVFKDLNKIGEPGSKSYVYPISSCFYKFCNLDNSLTCHRYINNRTDITGLKRAEKLFANLTLGSYPTSQELLQHEWCNSSIPSNNTRI